MSYQFRDTKALRYSGQKPSTKLYTTSMGNSDIDKAPAVSNGRYTFKLNGEGDRCVIFDRSTINDVNLTERFIRVYDYESVYDKWRLINSSIDDKMGKEHIFMNNFMHHRSPHSVSISEDVIR
jgi:hypothetical protein